MPTRNINNNLTVFGDGAEMFLKSADHNVARIIAGLMEVILV